ncbi:MAG: thiamine pyrophosphate-dependent enzyme, partial [Vulcanimicrobiaceae bacterium]
ADEACASIPGPVHVMVPADVAAKGANRIAETLARLAPRREPRSLSAPDRKKLAHIAQGLASAQRPVVIVRPSANRGRTGEALSELAGRLGITPVVMESPRGSEDLKYRAQTLRYADADYALVVGPADFAVHFLSTKTLASKGSVALIDAAGDPEPQRVLDAHTQIDPSLAFREIVAHLPEARRPRWVNGDAAQVVESAQGAMHPFRVGETLRETLGPGDLVVLDGGEFCQWVRFALSPLPNEVVWNSRLGAIGGSIPVALGAAIAQPRRRIVALVGDGAFGYHLAEIETAVREGVRLTIVVGNDERWGAEWHTQREKYGRAVATMLGNVHYDGVARGFGARGFEVVSETDLRDALAQARETENVACLNTRISSVRSPATAP